jgi:hypothetical protein
MIIRKNNKKHKTLSLRAMPLEELIRLARKNFDKGNLRIARDAYKELVRIDESRFLQELLICYNQMAAQMIDNSADQRRKIAGDDSKAEMAVLKLQPDTVTSKIAKNPTLFY